MQIARIEHVGFCDAEHADAGTRQIVEDWNAKTARADDQYARIAKLFLAARADIAQSDLSRVVRTQAYRRR